MYDPSIFLYLVQAPVQKANLKKASSLSVLVSKENLPSQKSSNSESKLPTINKFKTPVNKLKAPLQGLNTR